MVTKSERLKQSLAAVLRLASKKALLQAKLSPTSLKDNAEALHRLSLFLPLPKRKKKPPNKQIKALGLRRLLYRLPKTKTA